MLPAMFTIDTSNLINKATSVLQITVFGFTLTRARQELHTKTVERVV